MEKAQIGIIGGSGLYQMDGLTDVREIGVETPFGKPSDNFILGTLEGSRVAFLARHGRGHRLMPTELPFRANIYAMKLLGVERIISASAVGSLQERYAPMDIVIPDQFFDRTRGRVSTLAESRLYRSWGMDVIGMTNLQEAKLAREAEICYSTMALVTDYDCWRPDHDAVTVEMIIEYLNKNSANAQVIIRDAVRRLAATPRDCKCGAALRHAILTQPAAIPAETKKKLAAIIGKYVDE